MKEKEEELKKAQEKAEADNKKRVEMEEKMSEMMQEREKLLIEMQSTVESLMSAEERLMSTQQHKDTFEKGLNEALERLEEEEHSVTVLNEEKKKNLGIIDDLNGQIEDATSNIAKLESE